MGLASRRDAIYLAGMQWAWEYSCVPLWGMYLYPFIISLVAPLPLISAFLKLFNVSAVIAAMLFLYFRLNQLRVAPAWRIGFALYLSVVPTWCYVALIMPDALYGSFFWVTCKWMETRVAQ